MFLNPVAPSLETAIIQRTLLISTLMSVSKTAVDSCSHFIAEETEAWGMMGLTPGLKLKLEIANQLYMHAKILEFSYFYCHA